MSLRSFVFRSCSEPPPEHPPTTSKPLLGRSLLTIVARYAFAMGYAKGRRIWMRGGGRVTARPCCALQARHESWPLTSTTR